MRDLIKRDQQIKHLKKVGETLRKERSQLLKQLKTEYPDITIDIENDNETERLITTIKTLLEYLENMKNIETNNVDRINHAMRQIKKYIK